MDMEARAHSEHPEALRLWLRMLTCTQLVEKQVRGLLSDEHFSVDGTQVAAWASIKRFRAKDGSDEPPSGGRNGATARYASNPTAPRLSTMATSITTRKIA